MDKAISPVCDEAVQDTATPAWDEALSDHGFESCQHKGLTYPLGRHAPEYGAVFQVSPDIGWTRLPVPGSLSHINIWLLADEDDQGPGLAIVDSGLNLPDTRDNWEKLLQGDLAGQRITRVIITHFHPDHVGMAGWLCKKFGIRLWMNRTEWLMARMLCADVRDTPPQDALDHMRFAGWDDARLEQMRARGWGSFARAVSPLPVGHVRLEDGQSLPVGARNWQVLTGGGHTPEHVSLLDRAGSIIISGDQILPRISSNVSIMASEPEADPLAEWMASLDKFTRELSGDELVLPAHGYPFSGVHERLDALRQGHVQRLEDLEAALQKASLRATDCFEILFSRTVDDSVYGIATGEALAHLRWLERAGRAHCQIKDGVGWYSAS